MAILVAQAALVVVNVVVLDSLVSDGPLPEWATFAAPASLAIVVRVHRVPGIWHLVRGDGSMRGRGKSTGALLWGGLEAVLAVGFLVVVAVAAAGLLDTVFVVIGDSGDLAVGLLSLSFRSALLAALFQILLLVAVTGQLVATAVVGLGRRTTAARR